MSGCDADGCLFGPRGGSEERNGMESALLDLARTQLERLRMWRCLALFMIWCAGAAHADQASDGKALLERNCGRCHAVVPGADSPRNGAPNLSIVLESYPAERLQSELAEGIAPNIRRCPRCVFRRAISPASTITCTARHPSPSTGSHNRMRVPTHRRKMSSAIFARVGSGCRPQHHRDLSELE